MGEDWILSGPEAFDADGDARLPALGVLIHAVERLSSAADEIGVADIVRTAARKLTGADGVCVVLREGDLVHYVAEDAVSPLWAGQKFPIDSCISGWAIRNKATVVIDDIRADPRIPLAAYEPTFVRSLIMAPVRPDDPVASIGAYWAEVRRPRAEEVSALEIVARATAVALENVRLRRQLLEAAEEARAADRAKGAFLAAMSHEIRTPLHGVCAMADVLSRTELSAKQREMVDLIGSSADHLEKLVSDVLDFSRIEAGKVDLDHQTVDLAACVENAANVFRPQAQAKRIALEVVVSPKAQARYRGDPLRIAQIVSNLVSNAVKFTEHGGVEVRVDEEARMGQRAMVAISVTDTGAGFDPALKAQILEPFHQIDSSMTRRYGGSGLGLAIVKALVGAMEGELSVSARPGQGSAFVVRVPLEAAEGAPEAIAPPQPAEQPTRARRLRILCAEDHPANQAVIRLSLAGIGADIVMVADGAQAVAAAAQHKPDVILMDMQMPVLDGLEATRQIRRIESDGALKRTPIVMVTAHAMQQHLAAAFAAGVDGFVAKPMTAAKLIDAIETALAACGRITHRQGAVRASPPRRGN